MKGIILCVLFIIFATGCSLKHDVSNETPANTKDIVEYQNSNEGNSVTSDLKNDQVISEEETLRPEDNKIELDFSITHMDENHKMNEEETSGLTEDQQIIDNVTITPQYEEKIFEEKRIPEEKRIAEEKKNIEEQKDTENGGDTTTDFDVSSIHDNNLKDLEILNTTEYYPLEVRYDDNNQYVESISGKFSDIDVWDSEDALRSLYSVKTLLGLEDPASQLVLDMEDESKSGKSYTFNQYYENIEVFGSSITVSVDSEGKAMSLRSWIISNEVLSKSIITTSPKLSESEINQIIKKTYPDTIDILSSLYIFTMEDDDNPILIYLTYTSNGNRMGNMIISDANSGEVIYEELLMKTD